MKTELTIPFNIHAIENNPASQQHLEKNRRNLTGKCLLVLNIMLNGHEVWSDAAETRCYDENGNKVTAGVGVKISSLPRRILDLKQMGLHQWISESYKDGYKHWFIKPEHREQVLMKLFNKGSLNAA
jgi:hypothetical protein